MGKKENAVERPVVKYAREQGFEVRKCKWVQHDGAPDRIFMGHGQVFFIEFKAPGEPLRPEQEREIIKIRSAGTRAFVVDDVESGKLIIDGAKITGTVFHAE